MKRIGILPREQKFVLVGGLLISTLIAGTRGIPAWRAWHEDARASAAELVEEAERAERSVASLAVTLDSLEQRRDRLAALSSALVGTGPPPSAAATLAARVAGAAATARVEISAVQLQVDTAGAGVFTRVSVRASASGDVRGIVRMLADLERGPPLLAVREWSVSQSDPAAAAYQPETLRVDFVVEGLALRHRAEGRP
jgi:hypothetical protein